MIERLIELASDNLTGVDLTSRAAGRLLELGKQARTAAKSWMAGIPFASLNLPSVALGEIGNVMGGNPGPVNVGLILRPRALGKGKLPDLPVTFSSAKPLPSFQDVVNDLQLFLQSGDCTTTVASPDCLEAEEVLDAWLEGDRNAVLPDYIVERIYGQ